MTPLPLGVRVCGLDASGTIVGFFLVQTGRALLWPLQYDGPGRRSRTHGAVCQVVGLHDLPGKSADRTKRYLGPLARTRCDRKGKWAVVDVHRKQFEVMAVRCDAMRCDDSEREVRGGGGRVFIGKLPLEEHQ